jgi:hypothetical protein
MPVYTYRTRNKNGQQEERAFPIRTLKLDECPVSRLSRKSPDDINVNGPKAVRLVKLWSRTERNHTTLSQALEIDDCWLEDVEEILSAAQEDLKATFEREQAKRMQG